MDNGGFCDDHYQSGSSDDELVDISDVTVDFSEDVPPLDRDYSAGNTHALQKMILTSYIRHTVLFFSFYQRTLCFCKINWLVLVFRFCFTSNIC